MSADPCPGEYDIEAPVSSPVDNDEILVRFIPDESHVISENTVLRLTPAHFSMSDINGEQDAGGRRSISVFRFDMIDKSELHDRAVERTKTTRPLVAFAKAGNLREEFHLEFSHRDFCVFADVSEKTANFGVCPFHASVRKSMRAHAKHERRSKLILRTALSDAFCTFANLIS